MAGEQNTRPKEIRFVYQKARHHRTLHADGTWAGVTPQLEVQFAFFNNLKRMPDVATHQIKDDATLGPEVVQESHDVIREIDVTVVMNKDAIKATIELLNRMVEQIEEIAKTAKPLQVEKHGDTETKVS